MLRFSVWIMVKFIVLLVRVLVGLRLAFGFGFSL